MLHDSLIRITEDSHDVVLDIQYADSRNFTGKPVYAKPLCFLLKDAEPLLAKAIDLAAPLGYRLKIFDAFRPSEAQWMLWNHTPDPEFISDPRRGSPHSMGAAIDLTLIDRDSGAELDMGTGFDDLRPISHHGVTDISVTAQQNRLTLLGLMTAAGWDFFRNEWWHYQLFSPRATYPVLSDLEAGTGMMEHLA